MALVLDEPILDCIDHVQDDYRRPVVIYDLRRVRERLDELARRQTDGVRFLLAHKSCPLPEVTALAADRLSGFDVSNAREHDAVAPFLEGKLLSVAGPTWHARSFDPKGATRVIWNAASEAQIAEALTRGGILGIRLHAEGPPSGRMPSRFGFHSIDDAIALGVSPVDIRALHMHRGWDNNDLGSYRASLERIAKEIERTRVAVEVVNLGGGLHRLGFEGLDAVVREARAAFPSHVTIVFEPGRLCLDTCGFAVCRVVDRIAASDGSVSVVVDASHGCHFKWSEPRFLLPRAPSGSVEEVTIYGASCDESDLIGRFPMRTNADHLTRGTFLLLGEVSGYSAAWNRSFNGIEESDVRFVT